MTFKQINILVIFTDVMWKHITHVYNFMKFRKKWERQTFTDLFSVYSIVHDLFLLK